MKILLTGEFDNSETTEAPLAVSKNLYYKYREIGCNVVYLCYFQDGTKYNRLQKLFGFETIDNKNLVYRCGIFPYIFYVLKFKPDIIHFINIQLFYTVLFPLKFILKCKFFYTVHGIALYEHNYFLDFSWFQKKRALLNEFILMKFTDIIFVLSKLTARYIQLYYHISEQRIKVVPNGIILHSDLKKVYYSDDSPFKILLIGNLERKEKGFDFLLNVLSESKIKLLINIYGKHRSFLAENLSHLENFKIELKKFIPNTLLRRKMTEFDLFIAPSRYESFSLSLLEVMSTGLIFIASDRIGLTERFDDKLKKLVFRYNNKKSLIEKINYVINLKSVKKNELSKYTRNFANNFSLLNVCNIYLKHYNDQWKKVN